jgi:hypothetical protein
VNLFISVWSILHALLPVTGIHAGSPAARNAPFIKVVFVTDHRTDDPDSDTLFYNTRKLRWSDFRGQPSRSGSSGAVAFTSFAYDGSSLLKKDTLRITLHLQVFFVRSASWVRPGIMDNYALAHEQLHFDITWLVVQRFKQKILHLPLTKEDYDSMIQYEYLESFREMNRLQDAYDEETRHSLNTQAQREWADKIARELKAFNS